MCKARIPMSYVTLKEKLVWWPTKQIMKCYIWLCPSILPKYKLPPYPHPHPPIPVPPISNIPILKVRDLTYSKAFHARIEKQVKKIHSYDSQGKSLHSHNTSNIMRNIWSKFITQNLSTFNSLHQKYFPFTKFSLDKLYTRQLNCT